MGSEVREGEEGCEGVVFRKSLEELGSLAGRLAGTREPSSAGWEEGQGGRDSSPWFLPSLVFHLVKLRQLGVTSSHIQLALPVPLLAVGSQIPGPTVWRVFQI